MQALTYLYNRIAKNNIALFDYRIPKHKGTTLEIEQNYAIFINYEKIDTLYDEFNCVAHEYGHCMSGATHKLMSKFDLIEKHEHQAEKQSVEDLLPIEDLQAAIDAGCRELWQFSEHLDMPPEFIGKAIKLYQVQNILKCDFCSY